MDAENAGAAAYIGRWTPSSVSAEAAAFARDVIARTAPNGRERAKNLLWAAGKLADYGPWFDNHKRIRELLSELEELSLAIAENDPRWNR